MSVEAPDESPSVDVATSVAKLEVLVRQLGTVTAERDHYKQLADVLQRELDRLSDLQKTPREHVDANQVQLAFAQIAESLLAKLRADGALPAAGGGGAGQTGTPKNKPRTPHGRGLLPEHLPVRTLVITPVGIAADAVVIDHEVSWRLGFQRGGFYRLKLLRPVHSVSKATAVDPSVVRVVLLEGDVSNAPAAQGAPVESAAVVEPEAAEPVEATVVAELPVVAEPVVTADKLVAAAETLVVESAPAVVAEVASTSAGDDSSLPDSGAKTRVVTAELPLELIPRSLPTPDLLAHLITQKFADKNPYNRQEGIYAREGVRIPRNNMCRWTEEAHASCKRVVDAMIAESLATAPYICTDATGILVQDARRCKRGHFWVFVAGREHVFFRYSKAHSHKEPLTFFKGYGGTVVADASSVYDALYRQPDGPEEAGCNAHARRYFYKALGSDKQRALVGIGFYNTLFDLERPWTKLPPSERLALRAKHAAPLMDALRVWRDGELDKGGFADASPIRRALAYTRNHWDALTRFLSNGKLPAHNNWSEAELRRLVIGRANWLFVGSDESAEWTCTFVSLIASCALHGLDPELYLADLFRVLPVWPQTRMLELSPRYWARTRDRLDPFQLAVPIGPIAVPAPLPIAQCQAAE